MRENRSFISKLFSPFKKKEETNDERQEKTISVFLEKQNDLIWEIRKLRTEITEIKTKMDDDLKKEIDSTQKRYILCLEDKLVKFDDDVQCLKREKQVEHQRLSSYFYSSISCPTGR